MTWRRSRAWSSRTPRRRQCGRRGPQQGGGELVEEVLGLDRRLPAAPPQPASHLRLTHPTAALPIRGTKQKTVHTAARRRAPGGEEVCRHTIGLALPRTGVTRKGMHRWSGREGIPQVAYRLFVRICSPATSTLRFAQKRHRVRTK